MQITIDGRECDPGSAQLLRPGFDAEKLADPESAREGTSLTVLLPSTPRNDAIFGYARDPHTATRFNASLHTAEIRWESALLFSGVIHLTETSQTGFEAKIRSGASRWAKNAVREMLHALPVKFSMTLTPTTICAGWSDNSPVKFLPVQRDEYPRRSNSPDLQPAERLLSVDDYFPFLNIATLFDALFDEAGYRIESRFFRSEFFRSLYMSGAYVSHDTEALHSHMGFLAGRQHTIHAAADTLGRVYANPFSTENSVGNIVETALPQSMDEDGNTLTEVFDKGGCFTKKNGQIVFQPLTKVSVSFEYHLRYTTEHRIMSRTRLAGFDSVYLGPGCDMPFSLANRYADRRETLSADFEYRAIVFTHTPGARYKLTMTHNGTADFVWAEFAARSALVTTPATGTLSDPILWIRSRETWVPCTEDWALYDGYVTETGSTTVELHATTAPRICTPTSPATFDAIYFHGATEGMQFTLHKESTLRSRFTSHPGFGMLVAFEDVARHRIRQMELLKAIGHLFNLRFYTEERSKTVWIEPADDFYGTGTTADWRDRTDFSENVTYRDLALAIHEKRTWCYAEADGATARYNAETEDPFGEWTAQTDSRAAKEGNERLENPLFHPTINAAGHYANAPSALLPQVGNRDDIEDSGTGNFSPRILRYCGLKPLSAGERWGYPSAKASYPLAAFHFPGDWHTEGFTLCFEDREQQQGLHRYYDKQVARESVRQQIALTLRIEPHEFEALFSPGTGAPDIRSVFLIDTGNGSVRATLRRIESYDPSRSSARCLFIRLSGDQV